MPGPSHQRLHNNLVLVRLTRSDEGTYRCTVETERGAVTSPDYTVTVLGKKETREKTLRENSTADDENNVSRPQNLFPSRRV